MTDRWSAGSSVGMGFKRPDMAMAIWLPTFHQFQLSNGWAIRISSSRLSISATSRTLPVGVTDQLQ